MTRRMACAVGAIVALAACLARADGEVVMTVSPEKYRTDSPHIPARVCRLSSGEHDFGGTVRPALCLEYPFKTNCEMVVNLPIDADLMNDAQVVDLLIERTHPVGVSGKYIGGVHIWDKMEEAGFVKTQLVTRIRRELVHTARWTDWMDCRKVAALQLRFVAHGWDDTNALHKVWISDLRLEKGDSWAGTERDRCFRKWLAFCDTYEPDLSDSSACLEPPKEGRLAKPLKLVEFGTAQAEIVAPKDVYGSIELAARELQHWIGKMTGAELPIVAKPTGKKPCRIFLNAPEALERWKNDVEWLKKGRDIDGYFIHTDGNDIHIGCCVPSDADQSKMAALGLPPDACPVGVFRGAVALLENNSTILFASRDKEFGTVYDKTDDFVVRWGEGRERPSTCGRGWLCGNDYSNVRKIDINALDLWSARNRGNLRMPHRLSGHGNSSGEMIEYVPNTEPYQTFDGEKRRKNSYYNGQICLSAPDGLELAISNGVEKVKRYRGRCRYPIVSCGFWNEDNWCVCVCEGCTKPIVCEDGMILRSNGKTSKGGMEPAEQTYRSTQYMMFVNKLADGIAARCPGVKTEILAYLFQRPTPKCRISPNVMWTYCPYKCRPSCDVPVYHPLCHYIHGNFTEMLKLGGEMHVYDYQAFYGITKASTTIPEAAAEDYRYYDSLGVKNIGAEFAYVDDVKNPAGVMNGWLFNRVGWDADIRKVEGLRKYFLRRLYREGAPAAEEYFARLRRDAIRRRPPGSPAPKMLTGDEAKSVFSKYVDKITNPTAKIHYGILMKKAVGK